MSELLMRSIKIVDIGFIAVIYIVLAIVCAVTTDVVMGKFDQLYEKTKSFSRLTLELILMAWLYGTLVYSVRNLACTVPFPLHGYHGYDHLKVKELQNAMMFTLSYMLFSDYIKNKFAFYYNNLS